MPKPSKLSDQLRRAIDASDMSRYAICQRLDFDQAVLSRFMARKCGLSFDTLDRLGVLLDLELVARKRKAIRR